MKKSLILAAFLVPQYTTAFAAPISIVLSPGATVIDKLAVRELSAYVELMGNEKPAVAAIPATGQIYLGALPSDIDGPTRDAIGHALAGKDQDSFVLRSIGSRLIVYGNSPRANLYGVYAYLESLGVRWYYPGADNEVVPTAQPKLEGYNLVEVPAFHKRGIIVFPNTQGLDDLIPFAARARLNTIGLHSSDGYGSAAKRIEEWGLTPSLERHFFGESFCPDDRVQIERERRRLAEFVRELPPEMHDYFLWVADKYLSPCSSGPYSDYNVSDLVLRFSKEMALTLDQLRPGAKFAFLSYLSTWEMPRHEKPDARLLLEWAPISQSFTFALTDKRSAVNFGLRARFEEQLKLFGPANTQVLGYWLDDTLFSRAHYGRISYNPEALQADLVYLHELGIPAVTTFGIMTGRDYFLQHASPAVFLYPALLWDSGANVRSLMADYCRSYFGEDGAVRIYDLLAQADRIVPVESGRARYENLNTAAFLRTVSEATRLATDMLNRQNTPLMRGRAARLLAEVASRYIEALGPRE
ncbi:MAG: DUF4838 domain-containing protein [Bryobacteraceae bacterium]